MVVTKGAMTTQNNNVCHTLCHTDPLEFAVWDTANKQITSDKMMLKKIASTSIWSLLNPPTQLSMQRSTHSHIFENFFQVVIICFIFSSTWVFGLGGWKLLTLLLSCEEWKVKCQKFSSGFQVAWTVLFLPRYLKKPATMLPAFSLKFGHRRFLNALGKKTILTLCGCAQSFTFRS